MSLSTTIEYDDPTALARLLRPGALRPAFQPIVALPGRDVVAFEALARWPELPDVTADTAFATAARTQRITELDCACRAAALNSAVAAGGLAGRTLFVNVEPEAVTATPPGELAHAMAAADGRVRIVLELTERALLRRPAALMQAVDAARERGYGVALDDVGVEPASLALLPFVMPDVVKLDLSLMQRAMTSERARVAAAVMAHAERTGASVLAEGIESEQHVELAMALGATLGQGHLFGRPGPLVVDTAPFSPVPFSEPVGAIPRTPYDLVRERGDLRVGPKSLVLALTRHVEEQAALAGTRPVVLAAFQTADRLTPASRRRYADLATRAMFVGAIGSEMPRWPARGVRGGNLAPDDPLRGEWTVVVVADHYAGALIARDLGDDGPDMQRRFEFAVVHDRDTVLAAGRSLLSRIAPAD